MNIKKDFSRLLEPYNIGPVRTRNRMIKVAAGTGFLLITDIHPSRKALNYYGAIARGGVGLLIMEAPSIDNSIPNMPGKWPIYDDKYIQIHSELVDVIHKHGCPAFIQLFHSGPMVMVGQPVAASNVSVDSRLDVNTIPPRPLTTAEVKEVVDKFVSGAVRAQKAGFDGVEINAGCGHLLATFLSRFWNKRDDIYGRDSLENRTRILVEIIQGIKERLGTKFPVAVLINAYEVNVAQPEANQETMTIEEGQSIAKILEKAGADALQVRIATIGDHCGSFFPETLFKPKLFNNLPRSPELFDSSHHGAGAFVPAASMIKKVVSIPVITVGRLDPVMGEEILRQNKADFIGLNRRLIADPELPNKIASGRLDEIAPCTACLGCFTLGQDMHCRINAACGRDQAFPLEPAQKQKKVVVIGGGPSGMEVARIAALRGHTVTLFEKKNKLGGLLPVAQVVKGSEVENLSCIIRYLSKQVLGLKVDVKTGQEADIKAIEKIHPDVIISAGGGIAAVPELPGFTSRVVISNKSLHNTLNRLLGILSPDFVRWLTRFWMPLGKRIIIIGGDIQGCQLAQFLVERGRKVTIVEEGGPDALAKGMTLAVRTRVLMWLEKKGVTILTEVKLKDISSDRLNIINKEGELQTLAADNIVIALPLKSNMALVDSLKERFSEVYAVGDCKDPGLIQNAVTDGFLLALKI